MGRRNPIYAVGEPMRNGVFWMSDELVRSGGHDDALGSDGFLVMAFLLSWATGPDKRAWETSAAHLSEQFGWGRNRERARRALERATKDKRLVMRGYLRDGQLIPRRCAYVVCAGGRRFTDAELLQWSVPIALPPRASHAEGAS